MQIVRIITKLLRTRWHRRNCAILEIIGYVNANQVA